MRPSSPRRVYLKTNEEAVANHGLHPPECEPGTTFVERQLGAVPADLGAPLRLRFSSFGVPLFVAGPGASC